MEAALDLLRQCWINRPLTKKERSCSLPRELNGTFCIFCLHSSHGPADLEPRGVEGLLKFCSRPPFAVNVRC